MGLGVEMVVSIFLLIGAFLVEKMLYRCPCMWNLNVASDIGVYLVTWFAVNLGQYRRKSFLIALHQVRIFGENKSPW